MDFHLQMYSLRDEPEDFEKTIEKVTSFGYAGVEFAGYPDMSTDEVKQIMAKYNCIPLASHVGWKAVKKDVIKELEYLHAIGSEYLVIPQYFVKSYRSVMKLCKILNKAAKEAKKYGITVCYHNHSLEFRKIKDKYLLDIIMENTQDVYMELDVYWCYFSGIDAAQYITRRAGKVEMLHLKAIGEDNKNVVIGNGSTDWKNLIETAKKAGVKHFIVEQEDYENGPFPDVEADIKYLNGLFK